MSGRSLQSWQSYLQVFPTPAPEITSGVTIHKPRAVGTSHLESHLHQNEDVGCSGSQELVWDPLML